jgi:hypothetical protein
MTIVNDDSRVVNKLETSLNDDAGVVICDHHMFIAQAIGFDRYREGLKNILTIQFLMVIFRHFTLLASYYQHRVLSSLVSESLV